MDIEENKVLGKRIPDEFPEFFEQVQVGKVGSKHHPLSLKESYNTFKTIIDEKELEFQTLYHYIYYNQIKKIDLLKMDVDELLKYVEKVNLSADLFYSRVYNDMKVGLKLKMEQHPIYETVVTKMKSPVIYLCKNPYFGIVRQKIDRKRLAERDFDITEYETGDNNYGKLLESLIQKDVDEEVGFIENLKEELNFNGTIYVVDDVLPLDWNKILDLTNQSSYKNIMMVKRELYSLKYDGKLPYDDLSQITKYKIVEERSYVNVEYYCVQYSLNLRIYFEFFEEDKYTFHIHAYNNFEDTEIVDLIRILI